jgi:transcription antitermination factor NusG
MWFAVKTKSRHESLAARSLASRGVEPFLPVYRSRRQWSDRVKVVELPLFGGYFFARLDPDALLPVLQTPGVSYVVGFGGKPAPIPAHEIEAIRRLAASDLPANPHPYLHSGDRVRVKSGPLAGLEGTLVRVRNEWRFVLRVHMLQRAVSVEVDSELVEPLR